MSDRARIGFVGTGGMGQCAHLKNYAVLPECEVVAIAEIRPRLAERLPSLGYPFEDETSNPVYRMFLNG